MNIVILGAGGVGRYIAQVLSKEEHNVILIDPNKKKLEKASWEMDVAIRKGSGSDWQLLDDLLDLSPDFLIALTNQDEINLAACSIAKHLGYPRTIARVRDNSYLNRTRLDFSHIFEVDYFIGPELLVANDILKYMVSPGSLAVENFAHCAVQLRTLAIPEKWRKSDVPLQHLTMPKGIIVGLIRRDIPEAEVKGAKEVIFPHGQDMIKPGDEVTFIGEAESISELHRFLGIKQHRISSVVIVGGSLTGLNLARLLESRDVDVRLIEQDYDRCRYLAEKLPNTTIMNHQGNDLDYFKAEKIGTAEVFVACTESDEMNMVSALLGKEVGCDDVVITLSNTASYAPLANQLGINHTLSPRMCTADHILSQILGGAVTSLVSFYDNQAEILEINVSMESKLVGIPLSQLGALLPKDFLIAMIQNRGRIMVAHGNRIISPGDTVIVITSPKHIPELERIF